MIYHNTSIGTVIGKIFRDLNIRSSHWIGDAIEWSAEALEEIGAFVQLTRKVATVNATSFVAPLPIDLIYLLQVYDAPAANDNDPSTYTQNPKHPISLSQSSAHPGLHKDLGTVYPQILVGDTIQVNNGYLYTNRASSTYGISYLAMPTDDKGHPLVPDKAEYRDALFWYITSKLILSGQWSHPDPNINYIYAESRWQKACSKARNAANMPDMMQAEAFFSEWVTNYQCNRFINSFKPSDIIVSSDAEYGTTPNPTVNL